MTWHVYLLTDPRNGSDFYVGCTTMPKRRLSQHGSDKASAAWERCREIRAAGKRHYLRIVAEYDDKTAAYAHENHLIQTLPNLVNLMAPQRAAA